MKLMSFIGTYFKESSVHGLRYVAEGSNIIERMLWTITIAGTFALAGIMVFSNLKDLDENPISTSTDTIPVQNLPFPAVTMNAAKLSHPFRLVESLYNNVKYDCSLYANKGENTCNTGCMEGTEHIREDLMDALHSMIRDQYLTLEKICEYYVGSSPNLYEGFMAQRYYLSGVACSPSTWGDKGSQAMKVIHPCLLIMPARDSDELDNYFMELMRAIAQGFRMPDCLWPRIASAFEEVCHVNYNNESDWICQDAMMGLPDHVVCPAVAIYQLIVSPSKEKFRPGVVLKSKLARHRDVEQKPVELLGNLTKEGKESIPLFCLFDVLYGTENRSRNCPVSVDMELLLDDIDLVYKAYRHVIAPTSMVANEISEMKDVQKIKDSMKNEHNYNITNEEVLNDAATILACKYGSAKMSNKCHLFSNMFTNSGVGYTFNNVPYWDLFKNTTSSFAFYEEMYEKQIDFENELPRQIEITGKEYSLDFIIRHNSYNFDPNALVNDYKPHEEVLFSLHDPANVPDLNSDGIVIEPGMLYEIMVYPTVTLTDESGLALEPRKRNCHTREENSDLSVFSDYSQSACIFECQLQMAVMKCNCSAWDYPRKDPLASICLGYDSNRCFHDAIEAETLNNECGCLNDCEYINYEFDVHVTTLQHTNSGDDLRKLTYEYEYLQYLDGVRIIDGDLDEYWDYVSPSESHSRVRVSVHTQVAKRVTRSARFSFSNQVANLGGIIGLFTGMSILSLAETLYWVVRFIKHIFIRDSEIQ